MIEYAFPGWDKDERPLVWTRDGTLWLAFVKSFGTTLLILEDREEVSREFCSEEFRTFIRRVRKLGFFPPVCYRDLPLHRLAGVHIVNARQMGLEEEIGRIFSDIFDSFLHHESEHGDPGRAGAAC